MSRAPTLRYRSPGIDGEPFPGLILMGDGPRVRRAYRVLSCRQCKTVPPALGIVTWKLTVEPMSAAAGRDEIAAGVPWWHIRWDRRERRSR